MSPRFAPSKLSALFGRPTAPRSLRIRRRQEAARQERNRFAAFAEMLESRKLLAITYHGVLQTITTGTDESFAYVVNVDTSGGIRDLYIRYEALQGRIDFSDNPGFGTITNLRPAFPGFIGPRVPSPLPVPPQAPFSLAAPFTSPPIDWNTIGTLETFSAGALRINAAAGTRVFLVNGDALPLALQVNGNPASVTLEGPVDATLNRYTSFPTGYRNEVFASSMSIQALMATDVGTNLHGDSLVELENLLDSPDTDVFVGNGDFNLIAGAKIDGSVGIYTGQSGSTIGFGAAGGNILIDGLITGDSVTLNVNSQIQPVSIATGPSGLVSGKNSLTLFNSGQDGGAIDVRSSGYAFTNVSTGAPNSPTRDIGVSIDQTAGNLRIAAVPKSRGQISLKASAPNATITIDSNVETEAALALEAAVLSVNRPLRTSAGNIILTGDTVTIGSNVAAGTSGVGNILIKSRTGKVSLLSAAIVSAIDETIVVEAATDIDSQARLETNFLDLKAAGSITLKSNADELRAEAGKGINLSDDDSLVVRSAVAGTGDLTISAVGRLDVTTATVSGKGAIVFDAGDLLRVGRVGTSAGPISLKANASDVRLTGEITAKDVTTGLMVASAQRDIIVESTAKINVPGGKVALEASRGRVLTPGSVTDVVVKYGGTGYADGSPPTVDFEHPIAATATAVTARSDQVAGVTIVAGGGGYSPTNPPVVEFDLPPTGTRAQGVATVNAAGEVTGVLITNQGSGYLSSTPPQVRFLTGGGAGAGAVATAVIGSRVSGVRVLNGGSGYVTAPTVELRGGGGVNATARAFVEGGVVTSLLVTNPGTGYTSAPEVIFTGGSGSGAAARAQIGGVSSIRLGSVGDKYSVSPQVVVSSGDGATAGAVTVDPVSRAITAVNLSSRGADYGVAPDVLIQDLSGRGTGARATAALTTGVTSINVTSPGTNYSSLPMVEINPSPTGGRRATAEAVIAGSVVTGTIPVPQGGTNYSSNVVAKISGNGGAVGIVTISGGVSKINLATPTTGSGSGYSAAPGVSFSAPTNPGGQLPQATALLGLTNNSFTITPGFRLYTGTVQVIFSAPTVASPLSRTAQGVAVLGPTGSVVGVTITDAGAGYMDTAPPSIIGFTGLFTQPAPGPGVPNPVPPPSGTYVPGLLTVSAVDLQSAGSGYSSAPSVIFTPPPSGGTLPSATTEIRGSIVSVNITNGGADYPATPTLSFVDPVPNPGTNAVAPPLTLSARVVALRVTDVGSGYSLSAPVGITIQGGGGTGAQAVGLTSQVVDRIEVKAGQGGGGYDPATTTVRLVTVAGGGGATSGPVTVDAAGRILSINVALRGQDYSTPPSVTIIDTSGSGREAEAIAVVENRQVTRIDVRTGGVGYNPETTIVSLKPAGSGATAVANLDGNGRVASVTVTNSGSGYQDGAGSPFVNFLAYGDGARASASVSGGQIVGVKVNDGGANYVVPPKVTFGGGGSGGGATGYAVLGKFAPILATSLVWTAQNAPADSLLGEFDSLSVNLTAPGDLVISRADKRLTVLSASTKSGSIDISAPSLTIAGQVSAGNYDGLSRREIKLRSTSGNLVIDAGVGDLLPSAAVPTPVAETIVLRADNGAITATVPATAGLLTARDLEVHALTGITVRTNVSSVWGEATSASAGILITQTYQNTDKSILPIALGTSSGPLATNNGTITVNAGSDIRVGMIDAQPNGTVILSGRSIEGIPIDAGIDLRAATANLTATQGSVTLETSVATITASANAGQINVGNTSGATLVASLASQNALTLSSDGTINVKSVTTNSGDVSITSVGAESDISIGTIVAPGFPIDLKAGRSILQTDPSKASIAGGSANLTATAGTLDLVLATESASAVAPGAISLRNTGAMQILLAESTTGQPISLTAAGVLSQSGPIRTAGLLSVTGNGVNDIVLRAVDNQVGSFTGKNPGAGIAFRSGTALAVAAAGVSGGAVELAAGGDLTQQGPISATVSVDAAATTAGAVRLDRVDNAFPVLTGRTFNGGFTVIGAGGFSVGTSGIVAGTEAPVAGNGSIAVTAMAGGITLLGDLTAVLDTITLQTPAGTVTQTGTSRITAGTLRLTTSGPATLIPANNSIGNVIEDLGGNITIGVPGQPITVPDVFTATGNITILGSTITIAGSVQAAGTGSVTVTASGPVSFGPAGLLTGSAVTFSAVGDSQLRVGADSPVASATVTAGSLTLSSPGNLRQTGPIVATALSTAVGSGSIALGDNGNSVGAFSASAPHSGGNVQFVNASGFTVVAPGVQAGTAAAGDGFVTLTARTGGLSVSALIDAPGDVVELRAPAGLVTTPVTPNAQTLIIIDSSGGGVPSGPIEAGNTEALIGAIEIINSLPVTGAIYEVIVTSSLTLTQTLTFTNAIALSGSSSGVVIDGAGSVPNGIVIGPSASGSSITNLAFANFSGPAVAVNGAQNVAIQGLTVTNSTTGLALTGILNGTTIRGSTFRNVQTGIQLTGAQQATIGGTASSQRNRIEGATRAGVQATGFCTGTRVLGTTFTVNPRTRTQFNVRGSRGLRISGTTLERSPRVARTPINLFRR